MKEWNKFAVYSGGTLVEKCCHYFDLMNRIAASLPARVFASGGRAVNFKDFSYEGQALDIDDHALVIVEYENGVRGQFTLNMFSEELYEGLAVSGDRHTSGRRTGELQAGRGSSSRSRLRCQGMPPTTASTAPSRRQLIRWTLRLYIVRARTLRQKGSRPTKRWCLLCRGAVGYHYGMDGAGVYPDQYGC